MAAPMAERPGLLRALEGQQRLASDPRELVWLSASAGTGKTHVLTARVLRLLLAGVAPETILCLTFTKAGAAEMADRIHARLAWWVRLRDADLRKELFALGEANGPREIARARTLFASVLDAPGGGLRIQTIHAFCQTLLAGFPVEAGLSPGFRAIEGREEAALARATLAELLVEAERGGDLPLIADVQALSHRLGEAAAERYLMECARAAEAMAALGARQGIEARLRLALDVPLGDVEARIVAACADAGYDLASLRAISAANARWGTKNGLGRADIIAAWLARPDVERAQMLAELHSVWARVDGGIRSFAKGQAPQTDDYADRAARLYDWCRDLIGLRARAALATMLAAGLRAGQAYAGAYAAAKRSAGVVDFDDLIGAAVRLLQTPGMGDWVRYKLDRETDHILVDEAQDTNARQWSIVAALAGEYFSGEGARGTRHRTIFTVGDFKQAIFAFQGTDPMAFEAARRSFTARAAEADRDVLQLSLDRSFRSAAPILDRVDRVLEDCGEDAFGLVDTPERHVSARTELPGTVTLWRPVSADLPSGDDEDSDDAGEEAWLGEAIRAFATRLARQIRAWIDERLWVAGKGRPVRPEDILVLVRKRGALAGLIVARLHAEGVPVAGVDRLRLDAPLAVRDLMAALRFAAQPEDDLTLAALLVSPLFGLSQDDLYRIGFGRPGTLLAALNRVPDYGAAADGLADILARADYLTPYRLLEHMLSGPLGGRRKLLARLGEEARDPIEELLNAALAFEADATPTLQRFLDWFDRGEVEIKRDPAAPRDAVRVMTAHGSKGLQAPIVILADATVDPGRTPMRPVAWAVDADGAKVPVIRPRKAEMAGAVADAANDAAAADLAEHMRLLYVALTRAEERLVIAGALGPKAQGEAPAASWYAAVERAFAGLGAGWEDDPHWSAARHYRGDSVPGRGAAKRQPVALPPVVEPGWLRRPAPIEARPPRPLAPSSLGIDLVADPPPNPAMRAAAHRGQLLHALFERLPPVPPDRRHAAALRWLAGAGGVGDPGAAREIADAACAIIGDPAHTAIFAPDTLAEAPIAAVVGGHVVAGTIDRLRVTDDMIEVIDFKTGRRVPGGVDAVPEQHLRQMAAYVAALESVFPGRAVSAALLYTSGPVLIMLPSDVIARYKPDYGGGEQIH
jgi:ATP-dependent helicase/nuclease subunit A